MTRKPAAILFVLSLAVLAVALVPAVGLAAKGGNGGGGGGGKPGGGGSSSLSLVMVVDNNANGTPNHGDAITFDVTTTADRPYVSVHCYQGGELVYAASAGFYDDYPWSRDFYLATTSWTSGAADCTAKLYTTKNGSRITVLATLNFHVDA